MPALDVAAVVAAAVEALVVHVGPDPDRDAFAAVAAAAERLAVAAAVVAALPLVHLALAVVRVVLRVQPALLLAPDLLAAALVAVSAVPAQRVVGHVAPERVIFAQQVAAESEAALAALAVRHLCPAARLLL